MENLELQRLANEIRKGIIIGTHAAKSGHPGGSLSIADVCALLYFEEMNVTPEKANDPDRDRFVLSKGHLNNLRHLGAMLQGHPDMKLTPGVDMSTGSLGQGVSAAVGMALAGKMDKKDYRVYSILGDGEIQEGQVWEAAMYAGFKKLDNLCIMVDNNGLQIDGNIEDVCSPYPIDKKFEAFNFHVINADAHDFDSLRAALKEARETKGMPTAIILHSVKGKGVSFMENNAGWHGVAPNDEEFASAMEELKREGEALCQK